MAATTDIDYDKLILWMIPARLRRTRMYAWLRVMLWYVANELYPKFKTWETTSWYDLRNSSGQVAHLELAINDRFDAVSKSIYIGGAIYVNPLWLYLEPELSPQYLPVDEAEDTPLWLHVDGETDLGLADFSVNVPILLLSIIDVNELNSLINKYKREAKAYVIKSF